MSLDPEDDAERTLIRPAPPSGVREGLQPGHVLPIGMRLRDYEIAGVIGEGGFGIVYLAYDPSLQRHVAIKEYMPSSMASRDYASATVVIKSDRHEETFKAGLKSFVNEARLLARFDDPALVKVYRFWEDNGTAYMVMPYYEGPTLKSALAARTHPPDEVALRTLLRPLLDALQVMHAAQCFHRDIAPDNILLTPSGPLLLDFGAARRVIGDMTHALTVVLKPGYAPIEQYGEVATMAQGAWTDLYALACVVYFAITGKVPMSSVERLMDDRLKPLSVVAAGRYSARFLQAIDGAMALRPHERPQTVAQLRTLLGDQPGAADTPAAEVLGPHARAAAEAMPPRHGDLAPPDRVGGTATAVTHAVDAGPPHALEPMPASPSRQLRQKPFVLVAVGVSTLALAIAAFHYLHTPTASGPDPGASTEAPAVLPSSSGADTMDAAPASAREHASPARSVDAPGAPAASAASLLPGSRPASTERRAPLSGPNPPAGPGPLSSPEPEAPARPPAGHRAGAAGSSRGAAPNSSGGADPPHAAPPQAVHELPTRAETVPRALPARPAPGLAPGALARCSDILQKASLEPLTTEEAAYLKRECR